VATVVTCATWPEDRATTTQLFALITLIAGLSLIIGALAKRRISLTLSRCDTNTAIDTEEESPKNCDPRYESVQPPNDSIGVGGRLLRRRWARHRVQELQLRRQATYQELAWQVQDILVGCGLFQAGFSIGGGRTFQIPQVISVVPGPPVGLNIRMLPGQIPDDFAKSARRIAYNLDIVEVRVIPLEPYLIRLELVPRPSSARAS
jgi:hypothetical protein